MTLTLSKNRKKSKKHTFWTPNPIWVIWFGWKWSKTVPIMVEYHRPPFSHVEIWPRRVRRCPIWPKMSQKWLIGLLIEFGSFDLTANDLKGFLLWSSTIDHHLHMWKLGPQWSEGLQYGWKWPKEKKGRSDLVLLVLSGIVWILDTCLSKKNYAMFSFPNWIFFE